MKHSRRMFLGSTVAAAGGGALFTFGNTPFSPVTLAQSSGPDPIAQELLRQMKAAMQLLKDGKGEGARQFASALRLVAVQASTRDNQLRAQLREAVNVKGRASLVYAAPSHTEMKRLAAEWGVGDQAAAFHATHASDPFRREQALDMLLKEGLAPSLRRAAEDLNECGAWLDKRAATIRPVASLRQTDCGWSCAIAHTLGDIMDVACAAAILFPLLGEACIAASAAFFGAMVGCWLCQIGIF